MEHCSMDPYEQQLLSVFDSYDVDRRGSLDRDGLVKLCNTLQLEEQGSELIKCLLTESKLYVTFNEFKEGLLALLGNLQKNQQKIDSSDSDSESPDRELSPKFVYGSKKYGRRSRPEDNLSSEVFMDKIENKSLKNVHKVQRSNSQSDVTHSKKRKTVNKLKRCTSFPGNPNNEKPFTNWSQENDNISSSKFYSVNFECNESMLRGALERLGVGRDGYLNQFELVQVCESIGLHKVTKSLLHQLANKHELDYNRRISIEELLDALQKDDGLYELPSPTDALDTTLNNTCLAEDSLLYPNNKAIQYISLGPDGSGTVSSQTLIDMWENAGIQSASNLLQELGFNESQINISELGSILEEELRTLNDARTNISYTTIHPQVVLLQATITLYQSEVKYLKSVLEQLNAERDKLRCDIADANFRASLLAQEVDDNHAKMEKNTQKQVRLLEQRHSEVLKELTTQFTADKEQMSILNSKLEKRIVVLENEEAKLKSTIQVIETYNSSLEKENQSLSTKITEMEHLKNSLTDRVNVLESECRKMSDFERERAQLEPLLHKISVLQKENAELRDKNDELCTEVENLSSQVATMRVKLTSTPALNISNSSGCEENVSVICEGMGLGAIKRRVDSPSKDMDYSMESESPRLGKVRKCYKNQSGEVLQDVLGVSASHSVTESGFEAELDYLDSSLSFTSNEETCDEVKVLQARIAYLEKLLIQNSIQIPENLIKSANKLGDTDIENKQQLIKRCHELESLLEEVQITVKKMFNESSECENSCSLKNPITELSDKLQSVVFDKDSSSDVSLSSTATTVLVRKPETAECGVETDVSYFDLTKSLDEKIAENNELKVHCDTLQQAVELLRNEFENCENYWAAKLDEERQMFEQEQKQSSDKLTELLIKISEYEEQFAKEGRLPPIEENDLEKQYNELDEEFQQFKKKTRVELGSKDKEIKELEQKLNELQIKGKTDEAVQVCLSDINTNDRMNNLTNVIESSNIFSSETLPHLWQAPNTVNTQVQSDSVDSSLIMNTIPEREYESSNFIWTEIQTNETEASSFKSNSITNLPNENSSTCNSLPASLSWQPLARVPSPQPHSLTIIPDNSNVSSQNSYRVKRSRKHERTAFSSQIRVQKKDQELSNNHNQNRRFHTKWNNFEFHNGDQTCVVSINSLHHLHRRLHELDQHCRHLQYVLKQQQQHSESVMHHCWKQYRDELNDMQMHLKSLQEKLSRSDILIKDLYVENTNLIADNQRLEHRCHMLIQCNTESTSV